MRTSTRGKGHEEGGSTYAKAGSSLRSPSGYSRASVLTQTALLWIISSGSALLPSIGMQKDEALQSCCFCPFVGRSATLVAQMVKNLPAMQETQA